MTFTYACKVLVHLDSSHSFHGKRHCTNNGDYLSLGSGHHNAQYHSDHHNIVWYQHLHRSLDLCTYLNFHYTRMKCIHDSNLYYVQDSGHLHSSHPRNGSLDYRSNLHQQPGIHLLQTEGSIWWSSQCWRNYQIQLNVYTIIIYKLVWLLFLISHEANRADATINMPAKMSQLWVIFSPLNDW